MYAYAPQTRRYTEPERGGRVVAGSAGTVQLRDALNRSPRVAAQMALTRTLNQRGALVAQAKLGEALSTRRGQGPVVQRFWYDTETNSGVMWMDDNLLALMLDDIEQTNAVHVDPDGAHPNGPVWRAKRAAKKENPKDEEHRKALVTENPLKDEPIWDLVDEPSNILSVKDLSRDTPTAETRATEKWKGEDFAHLGWDAPFSQARITTPVFPAVHVTFWCKVGDIDVMAHLTKAGYSLIYGADRDVPGESAVDTSRTGLTGKDLYAEFLKIAIQAGGYREGANECQTFAKQMLANLTKAADKVQ